MPAIRIAATIQASPITFSYRLGDRVADRGQRAAAAPPSRSSENAHVNRSITHLHQEAGHAPQLRGGPLGDHRRHAARGRSRRRRRGSPARTPTAGSGRPARRATCDSGRDVAEQVAAAVLAPRRRPRQQHQRQRRSPPGARAGVSRGRLAAPAGRPGRCRGSASRCSCDRLDLQLGDAVVDVAHQAAAARGSRARARPARGPRGRGRAARARGAPRRRSPGRRSAGCRSGSRSRRRRSSCWVARISVAFSARPSRLSRSISRRPSREASRNHASSNSTTLCTERSPDTSRIA